MFDPSNSGRGRLRSIRFFVLLLALVSGPLAAEGAAPLGSYNADINDSSVSGISSGAFMAVQVGVAWSSIVKGVGVVAGGPYYCAQGTATEGLLGNLAPTLTATGPCTKGPPPALAPLFAQTDEWARTGAIDSPRNIARQRIYIFAGYNDSVVDPKIGLAAYRFYLHYLGGRNPGNLFFQSAIGAGHAQVTVDYGMPCYESEGYFIDHCHYDQAGIILQHIYGALNARQQGALSGRLLVFDQREFTSPASPASYSMADTGYVYVPADCAAGQLCRVHIALHGCEQNVDTIGDRFTRHAGYNEWADANRLIILYPQTKAGNPEFFEPLNPLGCWDWWGYTNFEYAIKAGRQIAAIKAMLDRLTSGFRAGPSRAGAEPPSGVVVNDVSDTGVALAWPAVAGAQGYTVSRAGPGEAVLATIGTVSAPSFGDMGLRPATVYRYQITVLGDGPQPILPVVTATTRPVPPRCATPGRCPVP
jgi:hypothetical protein